MTAAETISSDLFGDVALFAETLLWIRNKQKRLVPMRFNKAQKDFDQNRGQRNIILKSRQLGFSTMSQAYAFHTATTSAATVIMLAHDDATTQKLRAIFNRFWENLPADFRPFRKRNSDTIITFPKLDSEVTIATAGSATSGRGGTYSMLHGSEAAFWPDPEGIITGALQGGDPFTIIESTPNGAYGWFYETCMETLDGNPTWKLHFYPWWWDVAYVRPLDVHSDIDMQPLDDEELDLIAKHGLSAEQINWRRYKKLEVKRKFIQEYPEDPISCFLMSDRGFFGDISACWTAPHHVEPADPLGGRYVAGLDWGQSADYTVLSIFDRHTSSQVDVLRVNRLPWEVIRKRIIVKLLHWGVSKLYSEHNSIGNPNSERLRTEMRTANCKAVMIPFVLSKENKGLLLEAYAEQLQTGSLHLLNLPWQRREHEAFEMHQTGYNQWTYSAPNAVHDDSIIANMAASQGSGGRISGNRATVVRSQVSMFSRGSTASSRRNEIRYG